MRPHPVLVVHAGAGRVAEDEREAFETGVRRSLERGLAALAGGARRAVVEAVLEMEADPMMNAGRGAALDREGRVALDAGFMEGTTRRFGAVSGVTRTPHPVSLAEHLADEGPFGLFVAGPAADALAEELADRLGIELCRPEDLVTERERAYWSDRTERRSDTVGAVALDGEGRLAAAVSTGGIAMKASGRVGDSPVVGAGFWADDRRGACVATGTGEVLLREGTSRRLVELLDAGRPPAAAAREAMEATAGEGERAHVGCGVIAISPAGAVVLDHTTPSMPGGWAALGGRFEVRSGWSQPAASCMKLS